MKYIKCLPALAAFSLIFVAGCSPADENQNTDSAAKMTEEQMTQAEVAADDATQDWEAYAYEQRTDFIASMEQALTAIEGSIDELDTRVEELEAEAKDDATGRLEALRVQAALLKSNIEKAKNATPSTWDKVKASTGETYDKLKRNFNDARQWMGEAIAP